MPVHMNLLCPSDENVNLSAYYLSLVTTRNELIRLLVGAQSNKGGRYWYARQAVSVIVYVNFLVQLKDSFLLPPPLSPGRAYSRPQANFKKQYRMHWAFVIGTTRSIISGRYID